MWRDSCLLGVFVALYNYLGYRLMASPYRFSQTAVGLIFGIALVGIVSAAWVGDLAARIGRGRVFPVLVALIAAGVLMTLSARLALILGGMALATFAFYGAHSIASSWVGIEARSAKGAGRRRSICSAITPGPASSAGSAGLAWLRDGWGGVVALCMVALAAALGLSAALARRPRGPLIGRLRRGRRDRVVSEDRKRPLGGL